MGSVTAHSDTTGGAGKCVLRAARSLEDFFFFFLYNPLGRDHEPANHGLIKYIREYLATVFVWHLLNYGKLPPDTNYGNI